MGSHRTSPTPLSHRHWDSEYRIFRRLDWGGLDWIGLDWAGLDWAGLGWAGLGWAGLDAEVGRDYLDEKVGGRLYRNACFSKNT